jgi:hypothetical protein
MSIEKLYSRPRAFVLECDDQGATFGSVFSVSLWQNPQDQIKPFLVNRTAFHPDSVTQSNQTIANLKAGIFSSLFQPVPAFSNHPPPPPVYFKPSPIISL